MVTTVVPMYDAYDAWHVPSRCSVSLPLLSLLCLQLLDLFDPEMAGSERLRAAEMLYARCINPLDFWLTAVPTMPAAQVCDEASYLSDHAVHCDLHARMHGSPSTTMTDAQRAYPCRTYMSFCTDLWARSFSFFVQCSSREAGNIHSLLASPHLLLHLHTRQPCSLRGVMCTAHHHRCLCSRSLAGIELKQALQLNGTMTCSPIILVHIPATVTSLFV
jgi:hypothetical protein